MKHTPQPWLINATDQAINLNPGFYQINSTDGQLIALSSFSNDPELLAEKEANAVLIQHAPKLFQVLSDFVEWYEHRQDGEKEGFAFDEAKKLVNQLKKYSLK